VTFRIQGSLSLSANYLESIRKHLGNHHPDHTSSSKARAERKELAKCTSTHESRNSYDGL